MSNTTVVSLAKGGVVNLSKHTPELSDVMVGLGWDPADAHPETKTTGTQKKGFFGRLFGGASDESRPVRGAEIDCDAYAILLGNGKLKTNTDVVYFGRKEHSSMAVIHCGDNLTGHDIDGQDDDEQIMVYLNKLPSNITEVVIGVNIYQAYSRNQDFGSIYNAYIRLVDRKTNNEICRYALSDSSEYAKCTNVIMGTLQRVDGSWEFKAAGEGSRVADISEVAKKYT